MAKQGASAALELQLKHLYNFMGFTASYLRRNNPVKLLIQGTKTYVEELLTLNDKLKKVQNRINYERYKLKKTELILAQNSEHVFLRGRSLNQTR